MTYSEWAWVFFWLDVTNQFSCHLVLVNMHAKCIVTSVSRNDPHPFWPCHETTGDAFFLSFGAYKKLNRYGAMCFEKGARLKKLKIKTYFGPKGSSWEKKSPKTLLLYPNTVMISTWMLGNISSLYKMCHKADVQMLIAWPTCVESSSSAFQGCNY